MVLQACTVEGRLTAKTQKDAVWALLLNDALHELRGHRLEIDRIGYVFRRLDGGDIRIDEDGVDAFFLQGLECLGTAVVELASLTDLQGATAQEEDFGPTPSPSLGEGGVISFARRICS